VVVIVAIANPTHGAIASADTIIFLLGLSESKDSSLYTMVTLEFQSSVVVVEEEGGARGWCSWLLFFGGGWDVDVSGVCVFVVCQAGGSVLILLNHGVVPVLT
jgi:hypothetical protein